MLYYIAISGNIYNKSKSLQHAEHFLLGLSNHSPSEVACCLQHHVPRAQKAQVLQHFAIKLGASCLACPRISQEEPIQENGKWSLAIQFALVVGAADGHQVFHRFLDLLPSNLAVDLFQNSFQLWVGSWVLCVRSVSGADLPLF